MPRDPQQHWDALARANETRSRIAGFKQQLAARTITIDHVLTDRAVKNLFVWDVFQWQPRVHVATARRMFAATHIPVTIRCGNLSDRQVRLVVEWMMARSVSARRSISERERERWTA